jgi:hypothetical protein
MDKDFQTSFIPKKPILEKRGPQGQPIGFFTLIAFFIFLTVLLSSVGLYFYKASLNQKISQMKNDLELSKNRLDPSKITQLQALDKRLKASTEILSKHISVTPIFEALEELTMKSVRYTRFTYDLGTEKEPNISVKMSGVAIGYRSIALQSDLFAKNQNIIDPVSLDDSGNVMFELDFSVDPKFLNYKSASVADSSMTTN